MLESTYGLVARDTIAIASISPHTRRILFMLEMIYLYRYKRYGTGEVSGKMVRFLAQMEATKCTRGKLSCFRH
jgi:hypothetical protein